MPEYQIVVYRNGDPLSAEAEEMFARQLADSRRGQKAGSPDCWHWNFALTCALAADGHVLGGVHLDIGPIGGRGPLAAERLAYLERTLVRPEYRRQGVATAVMRRAIEVAAEAGCEYIRLSNNWNNPAETALLRKCGFALIDLSEENDAEPDYLAVRPVGRIA